MGTYLSLHFSVRARALSSLLVRKYRQQSLSTFQCHSDTITSNYRHSLGNRLRPHPRHEALVTRKASLDCIPHVAHPSSRRFHLDWY